MLLLTGLWLCCGRVLFGAGGLLVGVFAVTVLPVYVVVMGVAAHRICRDARRSGTGGTTPVIAVVQGATWLLALVFGFLVPDRQGDHVVSAASAVLGEDVIGLSAGFGNTAGILTLVGAFATLLLAIVQDRRGRDRAQGRPATEDEILDAQEYAEWTVG